MANDRFLWRAPGSAANGGEGVTVLRRYTHVDGNRHGVRAVAVRATELDVRAFEGGIYRTFTVDRSMAPNAIAGDALVITVSGDSITNWEIVSIAASRFASQADEASSTGLGIVE